MGPNGVGEIHHAANGQEPGCHQPMTRSRLVPASALWAAWLATRTTLYLLAMAPRGDGDVGI